MNQRDEILQRTRTVTLLPNAVAQAIPLFQDPETPVTELARVIECDPGLTSNVLRLANSAYYGRQRSISSVKDAIVHIGAQSVFHTVMSAVMASFGDATMKGYGLPSDQLWEHSFAVAAGASLFAEELGYDVSGAAHTAGQLHDIGKVVLGSFVDVDVKPIEERAFKGEVSFEQAEREILGIDHAEVGAELLERWNLPREIVEAVRWHHEPEQLDDDHRLIADLVHVANSVCLIAGIGTGNDGLNYHMSQSATARLKLTRKIIEEVACDIHLRLVEVRSWLNNQGR
ncbi:HDOD domain-containing protein [Candidatus Sumerlaeota bacterium]|nr:HDOD domain-containing protein [Candidatus Sumerlaeota bacterium]